MVAWLWWILAAVHAITGTQMRNLIVDLELIVTENGPNFILHVPSTRRSSKSRR
jgi:hypothetical protein